MPEVRTAESLAVSVMLSVVVFVCMIGLYVTLVAGWGYLTFRYLGRLPGLLGSTHLVVSVLALLVGLLAFLVLAFLVKPLIPFRRSREKPVELDRASQPELYAFVDALADTIGAPRPDRIEVCLDANASASFGSGLFGALGGKLTLTIGLPLVGDLSVRQFAGIVAHELGHFSQGGMLRQNVMLGVLSNWMTSVAFGEDALDRAFNHLATSGPFGVRLLCRVVRLVTNAIRRLLAVFMLIGHGMSMMTARQLEFDADQYMVHTAGADHFAQTMQRTVMLGYASAMAMAEAERFYRDRRLASNLPAMVIAKARRLTPEQRRKILTGHQESESESYSTHPLTKKRVTQAKALGSPGLVQEDRPAQLLMRGFGELCKEASEAFYHSVIRDEYDPKLLTDSSLLIEELASTDRARQAALRYGQSPALVALPSFPSKKALEAPANATEAVEELGKLRTAAKKARAKAVPLARRYEQSRDRLLQARQALTMTQVGFEIREFGALGLMAGDRVGLEREVRNHSDEYDRYRGELRVMNAGITRRIELVSSLLYVEKVAERIKGRNIPKMQREIKRLVTAGAALASVERSIDDLEVAFATLGLGLTLCIGGAVNQQVIARTMRSAEDTRMVITELLTLLHRARHPFPHGAEKPSVAEFLCDHPPDGDNAADVLFVAEDLLGRYHELRVRIVGRLCYLAEQVEKSLGLKPLKDPAVPDPVDELMESLSSKEEEPTGLVAVLTTATALLVYGASALVVLAIAGAGLYFSASLVSGATDGFDLPRQVASPGGSNNDPERHRSTSREGQQRNNPPVVTETPNNANEPRTPDPPAPERVVREAIAKLSVPGDQHHRDALRHLETIDLTPEQQRAALPAVQQLIITTARSDNREAALSLLNELSDDRGLAFLQQHGAGVNATGWQAVVNHVAQIGTPEAAGVLVDWLGTNLSNDCVRRLSSPPLRGHAEPHLIRRAAALDGDLYTLMRLLEPIATEDAAEVALLVLALDDPRTRRLAENILKRVAPRTIDAAATFLRLTEETYQDHDMRAVLTKLDDLNGQDDPRRAEVCAALLPLAASNDRSIQSLAWQALAKWGDEQAFRLCERVLTNEDAPREQVRTSITIVSQQPTAEAAESVIRWLVLETDTVEDALIRIGPVAERTVLPYITNDNADVRLACCRALEEIGSRRSLNAINGRGNDRDGRVRDAARRAFTAIRDRLNADAEG